MPFYDCFIGQEWPLSNRNPNTIYKPRRLTLYLQPYHSNPNPNTKPRFPKPRSNPNDKPKPRSNPNPNREAMAQIHELKRDTNAGIGQSLDPTWTLGGCSWGPNPYPNPNPNPSP